MFRWKLMTGMPHGHGLIHVALVLMSLLASRAIWAQTTPQQVVVTGNPLQRPEAGQPASVLSGEGLVVRPATTLGALLEGLPGVSSTAFGPNASRPAVRGLDGDRVRLLENSGASVDASNLSFDHAVALDPLVIERLEVLRGPAALLYGGNATGGVVNTLDNRIPKWVAMGLSGRSDVRLGGAAGERAASAVIEGGRGPWAWHVDGFERRTSDLRVPLFRPVEDGVTVEPTRRVRNSAAHGLGGAVGTSWVTDASYAGLALDTYRNDYGVTVEPDVTIRMKRDRLSLAGEWRRLPGLWSQLNVQASRTLYRHQEVEGDGAVGTTFESQGSDLRFQAQHAPMGPLQGVVGWQSEDLRFSALGQEAFVPSTHTRSSAIFVLETWRVAGSQDLEFSAGMRLENSQVQSLGEAESVTLLRFGAAMWRKFSPRSASAAAHWKLASDWRMNLAVGHAERAPAYYELFANGPHVATAAYERGDATLNTEQSRHLEAGLQWLRPTGDGDGEQRVKFQVFDTRFSRFIALDATGQSVEDLPEYRFSAVRARLRGWEFESRWRLWPRPSPIDLTFNLDSVRGDDLDAGQPLARLAPFRATLGTDWSAGGWKAGLQWRYQARQDRVPATDRPTPSAHRLDVWASRTFALGRSQALWVLRAQNLTDALWFNASTVLTMRGLAPAPGRSISTSMRVDF
ncbi:MAG: hypothetical protein RI949_1240 [Pseudomonadota bacterium]